MLFALAGCAVPPNSTQQSSNGRPAGALRTAAANHDAGTTLNFDDGLASMPSADSKAAKDASLSHAKPLQAPDVSDFHQTGRASWYGRRFHGRRTADGERFNMNAYTAAHRTLPLSSYVRVTNVVNGKSVVVKINDRGPYKRGRVLDLSYAAAKMIDLVHAGTGRVKIQGLSPEEARVERDEMFASLSEK